MEIIRKKTTLNNLNFIVLLVQDIKNLGLLEDVSDDMSTSSYESTVKSKGSSKLSSVRSYDYNIPYQVGINGVVEVIGDNVKYKVDDVNYETNVTTLDTIVEMDKTEIFYDRNNFIRDDNRIGLSDKIDFNNTVNIDRPSLSIIESFSKLQQITSPDELETYSNNFYKVYNETL